MTTLIFRTFQHIQKNFGIFFISSLFYLIHLGLFFSPFLFLCNFFQDAKMQLRLSTNLGQGLDNSPPLKRISSRDSEVIEKSVGYSARRRSSRFQVASFSE